MASTAFLIALMILTIVVAPAVAVDYKVGDDAGWKLGENYTEWAEEKNFQVGDTIVFKYDPAAHNVLKVNGADFQSCTCSNSSGDPLTTGNDVITLATTGMKWYICGIEGHCAKGMKLVIMVSGAQGPDPAPVPAVSAASGIPVCKSCVWLLAVMAAHRLILA